MASFVCLSSAYSLKWTIKIVIFENQKQLIISNFLWFILIVILFFIV